MPPASGRSVSLHAVVAHAVAGAEDRHAAKKPAHVHHAERNPNSAFAAAIINLGLMAAIATTCAMASEQSTFTQPAPITRVLDSHCLSCHDADSNKGDVRLDQIGKLANGERIALLNRMQEQVFSGGMPPKKKPQPSDSERDALLTWMAAELGRTNASTLEDKLRYYRYGNYINHEKLFSGEIKSPSFSPARRWRINELIYIELVNNVLGLEGKARKDSFYGIVKPFNLPTESGVRYYDTETVDGGGFLTLLANAKWIVGKQLRSALVKSGDFLYPESYLALTKDKSAKPGEIARLFPDETWNLKGSAPEFERVAMAKESVTEADLDAAITRQFKLALQRAPTPDELKRYLLFMQDAVKTGGTAKALEKMMVSVLMEPDFLYRSEFGGGTPDAHGRVKLTPREAAYAISYALTDQIPDQQLMQAVETGTLGNADDYRREVLRILNDDKTPKPRLLRFFQDFFGYYGIFNVFKDEERFIGAYNPHRVVSSKYIYRVPGKVAKEADALVLSILKEDKDVLNKLLTTDHYFVHHSGNNEEMISLAKKAEEQDAKNRDAYAKLKGKKGADLIEAAKKNGLYVNKEGTTVATRSLGNDMSLFAILYGEDGLTGIDRKPAPHDPEGVEHSIKVYNLDYRTWSYEPVQPIRMEHRRGLLTHPAWLISFSLNTHTDPVRRGKWVREKLLAGFIQDVPITVDAKVPEDHDRTLRERFSVTEKSECWRCHQKMNPLGYPFEQFDDFGRYRTDEMIEYPDNVIEKRRVRARDHNGVINNYDELIYKTKPVDARGSLDGTNDKTLDGDVTDAIDLIGRLAKSDRVRQSFIRNVFRYFMGRNEMLSDSRTLIEADRAYGESGGSFKALIVSLLTSDSFIYRKHLKD